MTSAGHSSPEGALPQGGDRDAASAREAAGAELDLPERTVNPFYSFHDFVLVLQQQPVVCSHTFRTTQSMSHHIYRYICITRKGQKFGGVMRGGKKKCNDRNSFQICIKKST